MNKYKVFGACAVSCLFMSSFAFAADPVPADGFKKGGGDPIMVSDTSDIVRAQPGQEPGGMAIDKVTARGTIVKVDKKTQSVTVKGPQKTVMFHVQKKDVFDNLKFI